MKRVFDGLKAVLLPMALFALCGCGSASSPGAAGTSTIVSGLASSGAPLVGTVSLKDAHGVTRTAQIDGQGAFQLDASGLTPPFLLKAGNLYSFAPAGGRANINPLTNVATILAADYLAGIDALYLDNQHIGSNLSFIGSRFAAIALVLQDSLDILYASAVTPGQRNFLNGVYLLDQGVEKLFSVMTVSSLGNGQYALTQTGQGTPFITIGLAEGSTHPTVTVNAVMVAILYLTMNANATAGIAPAARELALAALSVCGAQT